MTTLQNQLRLELMRTVALDMLHHSAANRIDQLEAQVATQSMQIAHDSVTIDCLNDKVAQYKADASRWKATKLETELARSQADGKEKDVALKLALEAIQLCRFDSFNMKFSDLETIREALTAIEELIK